MGAECDALPPPGLNFLASRCILSNNLKASLKIHVQRTMGLIAEDKIERYSNNGRLRKGFKKKGLCMEVRFGLGGDGFG
ncbi:hypothetical protein VNO80_10854 [Phaseolus coccineus]|uniref:Uncharacterized protein n=1 Tax=Phaseolus coccineus TaxID=3886 RepID=A0AAN9RJU6_PHACN